MTLNHVCFCALCWLPCAGALCSIPVFAHPPSTTVTAVVFPDGRYSEAAVREMGREAARILKRSGISLRSRIGAPPEAVSGLLVVVKFVGHCDMDGSPTFLKTGPLAWAHEVDGAIIPFSGLACDNLRGAVAAAMAAGNPVRGNLLLGRAMGRVLAHELYHIVADSAEHGRAGVTQAALTPRELTSGPLELQTPDVIAVEKALSGFR